MRILRGRGYRSGALADESGHPRASTMAALTDPVRVRAEVVVGAAMDQRPRAEVVRDRSGPRGERDQVRPRDVPAAVVAAERVIRAGSVAAVKGGARGLLHIVGE